mgnify:FL=1
MLDVKHGSMESALNAPTDGISMPMETVNKSATFAEPGPLLVYVKLATQDSSSKPTVNVSPIQAHSDQPRMIFALSGAKESVLNALKELSSIQMEFAEKFQPTALHGISSMDCVSHATMAMI